MREDPTLAGDSTRIVKLSEERTKTNLMSSGGCCPKLSCSNKEQKKLKAVVESELDRHTIALDLKYPALVELREALEERRQVKHPAGGGAMIRLVWSEIVRLD